MLQKSISSTGQSKLNHSEISILLDSYDDIFSDFDPSPISERTLSDDFIIQVRKSARSKSGDIMSLRFLLPEDMRKEEEEKIIIKRVHAYFKNVHEALKTESRTGLIRGTIFTLTGIVIMIAASYISFLKSEKYYIHFLLVLFEPGGWFLLWTGLDHLVNSSKEKKKDLGFYSLMSRSEITFVSSDSQSKKL